MPRRIQKRTPEEEMIYQRNRRERNAELQRHRRQTARNLIVDRPRAVAQQPQHVVN